MPIEITDLGIILKCVRASFMEKLVRNFNSRKGNKFIGAPLKFKLLVTLASLPVNPEQCDRTQPDWRNGPLGKYAPKFLHINSCIITHEPIGDMIPSQVRINEYYTADIVDAILANHSDHEDVKAILGNICAELGTALRITPCVSYAKDVSCHHMLPMYDNSTRIKLETLRVTIMNQIEDPEIKFNLLDLMGAFMKSAREYELKRREVLQNEHMNMGFRTL